MGARHGPSCTVVGLRVCGLNMHHIVLEDYIAAVEAAEARRDRLTLSAHTANTVCPIESQLIQITAR